MRAKSYAHSDSTHPSFLSPRPHLPVTSVVANDVQSLWSMLRRTRFLFSRRALAYAGAATAAAAGGGYYYLNSGPAYPESTRETRRPPPPWLPPSREHNLNLLRESTKLGGEQEFDLLVVGGGATGAGVAVDAASRGLKVALVERDDFSAGKPYCSRMFTHSVNERNHRYLVEIDKARPWRCAISSKGSHGA